MRTRYRALVRTWHPDRFAGDPQGQAEAAVRMREINAAYAKVAQRLRRGSSAAQSPPSPQSATPQGRRLTREEIESMIRAMRPESPLDSVLGAIDWVGTTIEGLFFLAFIVALVVRVGVAVWTGNLRDLLTDWEIIGFPAIIAVVWLRELFTRARLERTVGEAPAAGRALSRTPESKR